MKLIEARVSHRPEIQQIQMPPMENHIRKCSLLTRTVPNGRPYSVHKAATATNALKKDVYSVNACSLTSPKAEDTFLSSFPSAFHQCKCLWQLHTHSIYDKAHLENSASSEYLPCKVSSRTFCAFNSFCLLIIFSPYNPSSNFRFDSCGTGDSLPLQPTQASTNPSRQSS